MVKNITKNGFCIEKDEHGFQKIYYFYKNKKFELLECTHFYRGKDGTFKDFNGDEHFEYIDFMPINGIAKSLNINGAEDESLYKEPDMNSQKSNFMLSRNGITTSKSIIKNEFFNLFKSGYFFRSNYTPDAINALGIYAYGSNEAWEQAKREFYFPSFANDNRLKNSILESGNTNLKYIDWKVEFKFNEWTIVIIVNEDLIPTFIASNNDFTEPVIGSVIFGSEVVRLIRNLFDFGYFQSNSFDEETIKLITEVTYEPNCSKKRKGQY